MLGVPGLIASGTELVTAFVMGLCGSVNWALHGMIDIRLVLIILGGSLLGVQLGAIGTTYVRENMIKLVMGTIMLIVAVSRVIAIPCYLERLDVLTMAPGLQTGLKTASFICMCLGLLSGAALILAAMWRGRGTAAAPAA